MGSYIRILDVFLAGAALHLAWSLVWKRDARLPPGPRGWPLIGNLFDLRTPVLHESLVALGGEYGPIVHLTAFGRHYMALNSLKANKDLLEKMSAVTSNRPDFTLALDLVGWGSATGFMQHGDAHRKHRRFFRRHIGTNNSLIVFHPAEEDEAKQFVRNVSENPGDLIAHCNRSTASLILKFSHGYSVKDDGDSLVKISNNAMATVCETMKPGTFLVDYIPILRYLPEWFPGCGFHKDVRKWRKLVDQAAEAPHKFVLERLARGDATPSFTSRMLQDEHIHPEDEEILKWASISMYLGGSETTPSMLSAFFLAMTIYPEVFRKAQAEVDTVIGNKRLPSVKDRGSLPYVSAICTELLRWNVLVPFRVYSIVVHVTTDDIIYEGYFIPQGTWLLGNAWFILSDPQRYPNPDVFDPERYIGEHQQPDPRQVCFGMGRRSCLGMRLAELTMFAYISTALATLDVSRCVENGVELIPKREFEEEMIRRVKPFKCRIVLRSKEAEDLLQT